MPDKSDFNQSPQGKTHHAERHGGPGSSDQNRKHPGKDGKSERQGERNGAPSDD